MSVEELVDRLTMTGLNLEGTKSIGDDLAIDLEVTSNRPDCLGHLGVAREISVLWNQQLQPPDSQVVESQRLVGQLVHLAVDCPELCNRYTARVICGVAVGPSPEWLVDRLRTIGMATVNNVVDITNYVLMEVGQPLHAFDLDRITEQKIVVRKAMAGESFVAIDHKKYQLETDMCVIADPSQVLAIGGVMGGLDTEVSGKTNNVLIESAQFDPVNVRNTARQLNLYSPSSYRFERGIDPEAIDWASRRACRLILELAGGELATGFLDMATTQSSRQPIILRLSELKRILGIEVPAAEVREILAALGNDELRADDRSVEVVPPSWRQDLVREIDLVEEVARIHGYEKIPEDVGVPMVASGRLDEDRVWEKIRHVMTAAGFDEAMTLSVVEASWSAMHQPWGNHDPLQSETPVLRRADCLRQTLVPSLLATRQGNETRGNQVIELFEIAKVYLPQLGGLPREEWMLALTSGDDFMTVKGVIQTLVQSVSPGVELKVGQAPLGLLDSQRSCTLELAGKTCGYLGELGHQGLRQIGLREPTTVAEVRLSVLVETAVLAAQHVSQSLYPAVTRDRNFVFDQQVRWAEVAAVVQGCGGELLERLEYQETYYDEVRLGHDKKSILFTMILRSDKGTLTREEADAVCSQVDVRLQDTLGGCLRE